MKVSLSKIKEHPLNEEIYGNISDADIEALSVSIKELGLLQPLILNKSKLCISGHRRLRALRKLNVKTADCIIRDVEDEDLILFLIESNRAREKTARHKINEVKYLYDYYGRNQGKRGDLQTSVELYGGDTREKIADDIGTSTNSISRLLFIDEWYPEIVDDIYVKISLNSAFLQVKAIVEKEVLKVKGKTSKNSKVQKPNTDEESLTIYHQSCESMHQVEDETVQFIFTSPPYYRQRLYGVDDAIGEDEDLETYLDRMMVVMAECHRVLRNDGTMFLVYGDKYENGSLMLSHHRLAIRMVDELGWKLKNNLILGKINPKPESVKKRFAHGHEDILFFTKSNDYQIDLDHLKVPYKENNIRVSHEPKHHLLDKKGRIRFNTSNVKDLHGKIPNTIDWGNDIIFSNRNNPPPYNNNITHSAAFPYELVDKFTKACLHKGQTSLDPFMGSGTTLHSVINNGGKAIGYEIQEAYIDICRNRILGEQN